MEKKVEVVIEPVKKTSGYGHRLCAEDTPDIVLRNIQSREANGYDRDLVSVSINGVRGVYRLSELRTALGLM